MRKDARTADAEKLYWHSTPQERREALMPFLWSTIASQGQIFGNRDLGSESQVTNGLNFSYPGYNETLTGVADPRIHSNDNVPNPNVTVFEWLNAKPAFRGQGGGLWRMECFQRHLQPGAVRLRGQRGLRSSDRGSRQPRRLNC